MQTKKLLISLVIAAFGITLAAPSAMAGSKQQHRWEGVAIGIGAAILGQALFQANRGAQQPQVVYVEPEPSHRYAPGPPHRHGRWEWQKSWVPPIYERVWNPGHYNRNGHWVAGHWIEVQTHSGYWTRERVWVADRRGPY